MLLKKMSKYILLIQGGQWQDTYYYESKKELKKDLKRKLDSKWNQKPYYIYKRIEVTDHV